MLSRVISKRNEKKPVELGSPSVSKNKLHLGEFKSARIQGQVKRKGRIQ